MFLNGVSVNIDPNKVVDYCKQAAEMGSETAKELISEGIYEKIGDLYYIGYSGKKDYHEAVLWYEKAYENGQNKGEYDRIQYNLAESYVELGKMYYNGKLKKRDYRIAISYFEKAIAINSSYGKLMLGKCYIYGYGVAKSVDDGIKLICEAAQAYIPAYEFLQQLLKKEKDTVIEYIRKYYNNILPEYQLNI
jgi:TPR repeat protein